MDRGQTLSGMLRLRDAIRAKGCRSEVTVQEPVPPIAAQMVEHFILWAGSANLQDVIPYEQVGDKVYAPGGAIQIDLATPERSADYIVWQLAQAQGAHTPDDTSNTYLVVNPRNNPYDSSVPYYLSQMVPKSWVQELLDWYRRFVDYWNAQGGLWNFQFAPHPYYVAGNGAATLDWADVARYSGQTIPEVPMVQEVTQPVATTQPVTVGTPAVGGSSVPPATGPGTQTTTQPAPSEPSPSGGTVSMTGVTASSILSELERLGIRQDAQVAAQGGKISAYQGNFYLEHSDLYPGFVVGPGEIGVGDTALITIEDYAARAAAYIQGGAVAVPGAGGATPGPAPGGGASAAVKSIGQTLREFWVWLARLLFGGR